MKPASAKTHQVGFMQETEPADNAYNEERTITKMRTDSISHSNVSTTEMTNHHSQKTLSKNA